MIVRQVDEDELRRMVERNPQRMDYYRKYQEIVAAYNREKDRATVEQVFAELVALAQSLDAEERRAVEEVACGEKVLSNVVSNDTTRGSSRSPSPTGAVATRPWPGRNCGCAPASCHRRATPIAARAP